MAVPRPPNQFGSGTQPALLGAKVFLELGEDKRRVFIALDRGWPRAHHLPKVL